eukprot:Hpha_TRINITY_DN15745_c3_g1::TRINITY_DN15745_c3_g1_i2::g.38324::m.38324/K10406/KIFC2_3; kinesin family member C2/C3
MTLHADPNSPPQHESIRVLLRVRPPRPPTGDGEGTPFEWSGHRIRVTGRVQGREPSKDGFRFERIFGPEEKTRDVYEAIAPAVSGCLDGISATVMAYGQTAAGKTHTVVGTPQDRGVALIAVEDLLREAAARRGWEYSFEAAFFEVHNERVYDLAPTPQTPTSASTPRGNEWSGSLDSAGRSLELKVTGSRAEGLAIHPVSRVHEVDQLLRRGGDQRRRATTLLNDASSRSHAILQVDVRGREQSSGCVSTARLTICDLAGSEQAARAGTQGDTLREGGNINKSLLALRNVIHALAAGQSHVPWRDSKLTRLMQGALGNGARAAIICCIAPEAAEESITTLQFAERASTVSCSIRVNQQPGQPGALVVPVENVRQCIELWEDQLHAAEEREKEQQARAAEATKAMVHQILRGFEQEAVLWSELELRARQRLGKLQSQMQAERELRRLEREEWEEERRKSSDEIRSLKRKLEGGDFREEPGKIDSGRTDGSAMCVDGDTDEDDGQEGGSTDLFAKRDYHRRRMRELQDQVSAFERVAGAAPVDVPDKGRKALGLLQESAAAGAARGAARKPLGLLNPQTGGLGLAGTRRNAMATPPRPPPSAGTSRVRVVSQSATQPRRLAGLSPEGGARRRARTPTTPQQLGRPPRDPASAGTGGYGRRLYHTPPPAKPRGFGDISPTAPGSGTRGGRRREEPGRVVSSTQRAPQNKRRRT